MLYGEQRCLSRITTDLSSTGNRENLTDDFRFVFDDATLDRNPEKRILLKAFDIDFAANFDDNLTQVLVGECKLDTKFIRMN
jgi:hypothetical protein